ncbi:hypothetical protein EVAR_59531_1 [Eumeta japonica]|uniref:Uncharacterized protein n=1 Tax=Eumeta variegata TaxID=151549 RepID=A0A4C1XW30_EUMVA|nr:hypothetical protein EVAR_59531_1 [Eumeta japonica]
MKERDEKFVLVVFMRERKIMNDKIVNCSSSIGGVDVGVKASSNSHLRRVAKIELAGSEDLRVFKFFANSSESRRNIPLLGGRKLERPRGNEGKILFGEGGSRGTARRPTDKRLSRDKWILFC